MQERYDGRRVPTRRRSILAGRCPDRESPSSRPAPARARRSPSPRSPPASSPAACRIEHILAVTFTRIATAELRGPGPRPAGLGRGRPGPLRRRRRASARDDRVARLLARGAPGEVSDRRRLLTRCPGHFRCRHDHDDARLLPSGARRPGRGGPGRRRRHADRGRQRHRRRGGRRPLPAEGAGLGRPTIRPQGRPRDRPGRRGQSGHAARAGPRRQHPRTPAPPGRSASAGRWLAGCSTATC